MYKIPYFDIAALVIIAVITVAIVLKGFAKRRLNREYLLVLIVALFATAFDVATLVYDNMQERHAALQYFYHTGYLFFHGLTAPFFATYVICLVDRIHVFRNTKSVIIMMLPVFIQTILLIINLFVPCVFSIEANGEYNRGIFLSFFYVIAVLYMCLSMYELIVYRNRLSVQTFVSVVLVMPVTLLAIIIQFIFPQLVIEMFANALCFLFVALFIQNSEFTINVATGLNNIATYMKDLSNAMDNNEKIEVVMVSIINEKTLKGMLGVIEYRKLIRLLAADLENWTKSIDRKIIADWYYLDNGMFRCILRGNHKKHTQEIAVFINNELKKGYQFNEMLVNFLANICILKCPDDISDVDSIMRFGIELSEKEYSGEIIYAGDIYKKHHYDLMKDMDMIIDKAYTEGRFEVYYQPIYSVESGRYNSAEALLRLRDDTYGFVAPDLFIPAAEKSGMIHKIGRFVLDEVCQFISSIEFQEMGLDYIEVNLSVMQCMSSELSGEVREIIEKYGIRPEQINLEITETAAAYAQNTMMENITKLTKGGIEFSLDDFGTGYSNMKRIASLPFSIVKLDKTFADIDDSDNMRKIVKDTIYMVKDVNMRIVVEGVETENAFEVFKELGVDYIQGYYFSRPLPRSQFINEVFRINSV